MLVGVIIFGSVWFLSKKITKPNYLKKKWNQTETRSNRPVRFGFFRAKTGSNQFGSVFSVLVRFFPVLARFFLFGLIFFVWLGFFLVFLFRFGFFGFLLIKPKPNRTGRFFKILIDFFQFDFFSYFFLVFQFNWFFSFFPVTTCLGHGHAAR